MKTRQQRLAEERAGHPPSPPQALVDNPRGLRRTRAKTPSATVAVGSVEPAAQPAVPGEPQAILQVWADAARAGDDPTHTFVVSVSRLPEVMAYLNAKGTNQGGPGLALETPTPRPLASSNNSRMAQELSDEASASDAVADEDTDMDEASESDSSTGHPAESSLDEDTSESHSTAGDFAESSLPQATQSAPGPSSGTPRGSRWGSWFQSARSSLTNRFGFSPLTPISERSEPTTTLTHITTTAPTPKNKTSMPTSGRAERAKSCQQNGLLAMPVKRGQEPRGNKASPKNSPAMGPIHRDEEEVQQAKSGESNQPILWPSRSLETMQTSQKRKCWGDSVEQEPSKLRRIGDKRYFSRQQFQVKTPIAITNPAGTFKVPSPSDSDWSDSDEGERGFKVPSPSASDNGEEIVIAKAVGRERGFRVPSPSDSDASDGDEKESNVTGKADENLGPAGGQKFHAYQEWCKTANPAVVAVLEGMEVDPQIAGEAFEGSFNKFKASG